MVNAELEKQYVVSKLKSDLPELMEDWAARSRSYRVEANASYDIAYGEDPRETLDLFYSGAEKAPLLIYFHGGYWQRGDKSIYSFIAKPFIENGVDVVIVGYPLCPQVSLTSLVNSVRQSLVFLFNNANQLNINRERFNLCGNSAGGHLVAMMMATDWQSFDNRLPKHLVKMAVLISGLYQLEPMRHTTLNEAIQLDEVEARENSPQFLKPVTNAPILAAVGGAETSVFFSQMQSILQSWRSKELIIDQHVEGNADHFDMIDRLGDAGSDIFQELLRRLR